MVLTEEVCEDFLKDPCSDLRSLADEALDIGLFSSLVCGSSGGWGCSTVHHGCEMCSLSLSNAKNDHPPCPECVMLVYAAHSEVTAPPTITHSPEATASPPAANEQGYPTQCHTDPCISQTPLFQVRRGLSGVSDSSCNSTAAMAAPSGGDAGPGWCLGGNTGCRLCRWKDQAGGEEVEGGSSSSSSVVEACPSCLSALFEGGLESWGGAHRNSTGQQGKKLYEQNEVSPKTLQETKEQEEDSSRLIGFIMGAGILFAFMATIICLSFMCGHRTKLGHTTQNMQYKSIPVVELDEAKDSLNRRASAESPKNDSTPVTVRDVDVDSSNVDSVAI